MKFCLSAVFCAALLVMMSGCCEADVSCPPSGPCQFAPAAPVIAAPVVAAPAAQPAPMQVTR